MANTTPIFPITPNLGFAANVAATTTKDGTDNANMITIFTAGGSGSFVRRIRFKAMATTVAGLARIFLNNGSDPTNAANNSLLIDVDLPAVADIDAGAVADVEVELNEAIPADHLLRLATATITAGAWQVNVFGGDY